MVLSIEANFKRSTIVAHHTGKGDAVRAGLSAAREAKAAGGSVVSVKLFPAKTTKASFVNEAKLIRKYGGIKDATDPTRRLTNRINSPGEKYLP